MATSRGQPLSVMKAPKTRPVKATMEPMERSNSPPIIRSAAAMARMPSCDAGERMFMMPASVNIDESAVERKKIVTRTRPARAPSSGRRMIFVRRETSRRRSS